MDRDTEENDGQSEQEIEAIGMIASALHYCAENDVDFSEALDSARQGFTP